MEKLLIVNNRKFYSGRKISIGHFLDHYPDDHEGGRAPVLDLQVWSEEGSSGQQVLLHAFYEKPVSSPLVVMEQSALPAKVKIEDTETHLLESPCP